MGKVQLIRNQNIIMVSIETEGKLANNVEII
jgi:hypothetical protein